MKIQKEVLKISKCACQFITHRMISRFRFSDSFQSSRPGESAGVETDAILYTPPDQDVIDTLPARNEKEWHEKIDEKIKKAKEVIMENEMNAKILYLRQRSEVIHRTTIDSTK